VTRRTGQDTRLALAVTALFVVNVAVPRAGMFYHEHPGGEHAHVHADDGSGLSDLLEDYWHGHDHHHDHPHHAAASDRQAIDAAAPARDGARPCATIETDDGAGNGHWHEQQQFHRAVVAAVPLLDICLPAEAAPKHAPSLRTHVAALDLRARGPPVLPLA
jgi:hypothetical protein